MRERSAMLASVTFAFVLIAGLVLQSTLSADAEDCIAKPNAPAPQGEHWYYRIDHANNRQCWRLGPEGTPRAIGRTSRAKECAANREAGRAGSRSTAARAGALASPGNHRIVRCSCCKGRGRARAKSCVSVSGLPSAVPRYAENARPSALRAACATAGVRRTDANRQRDRRRAGGGQFRVVKRQ